VALKGNANAQDLLPKSFLGPPEEEPSFCSLQISIDLPSHVSGESVDTHSSFESSEVLRLNPHGDGTLNQECL
jgi:hypothetical protein